MHFSSGFPVAGYAPGGVGWSFIPTSDLLVTGISSTAPQVSFWSETNQVIANYDYTGSLGNFFTGPSTNFQAVPSLLLSAGHTYFISAQFSNFTSSANLFVYSRNGVEGILQFDTSSYISQFASYYLSPSGEWSPTTSPASENVNLALLGPNFQFQIVPEPTSFGFLTLALLFYFRRRDSRRE
ncbi:MAG: hypothetical protein MUF81_06960 [Verrucomicrobia bacterium]|nr:hypothetical protein [Verrucomicrobiota bacterium]